MTPAICSRYHQNKEITYQGCILIVDYDAEIQAGDTYIAQRNTGLKFLTCRFVSSDGYIISKEGSYPYDIHECAKVINML